jgi:hypothetical protein
MIHWFPARVILFSKMPEVLADFYKSIGFNERLRDAGRSYLELEAGTLVLSIHRSLSAVSPQSWVIGCADARLLLKSFRERSVPAGPLKTAYGRFFFEMKDPDGNTVVFESDEGFTRISAPTNKEN